MTPRKDRHSAVFQIGDELHTRTPCWFNRAQNWFVTKPGETPTLSFHVGGFISPTCVMNAHFPRVRARAWPGYRDTLEAAGGEWCVLRPSIALSEQEQDTYRTFMLRHEGARYSVPEIGGQAIDGLVSRLLRKNVTWFAAAIDRVPQWVICSGLEARAYAEMGRLPEDMVHGSPDDLWDYRYRQMDRGEVYIVDHTPGWLDPVIKELL